MPNGSGDGVRQLCEADSMCLFITYRKFTQNQFVDIHPHIAYRRIH